MSSEEGGQMPFVIVHRNVFTPTFKPVTPDVGELGVVTDPEPVITLQLPVPADGEFPASVAEPPQTD